MNLTILKVIVKFWLRWISRVNKMSPNRYKQMLHKEVIKQYKKAPPSLEANFNKETEWLPYKLKVEDRIEKFNINNCFITLKGHKGDFQSNPSCKMINPSKTQMGKITKKLHRLFNKFGFKT